MTSTLDPLSADEVYIVRLEPHPRSRVRTLVHGALDLWCATTGGLLELTKAGDAVVRRRSDGVEELRMYAGPPDSAAPMIDQLNRDLAALSPDEFRSAWGVA